MAGFYGADTDALRDIAGVFWQRSRRLEELLGLAAWFLAPEEA